MNKGVRPLLPLLIFFLLVAISLLAFSHQLLVNGFDTRVLGAANTLFFMMSIISYFVQLRGVRHANPHVFVRSVMSGMMLKMVVCIIAVFAYVYYAGAYYNKKSVFVALFLYLIYLAIEVAIVMKMNKKKNA